MAVNKPSRNEQTLRQLSDEVRTLKLEVDESYRTIGEIREQIKQYKAKYVNYIENLDRERIELESQIANCRIQIQRYLEPASESDENDYYSEEETIIDDEVTEDEEGYETPDPICPTNADDSGAQKRAFRHFAQLFHPDKHMKTPDYSGAMSMQKLTLINRESEDIADFLTAIPWGDEWLKCGENETEGSQIPRLNDWADALEIAKSRTEQVRIDLERDIYYNGLTEKQAADERGEDYFARLSKDHVDEIERLKQTLVDLQTQLNVLQKSK